MIKERSGGFTIVELIVTIIILVIMTTLVVARLSSTQASGRDQERQIDIETIATGLETYYENGDPILSIPRGNYPGAAQVQAARIKSPPFSEFLDGVSQKNFEAPERTLTDSFGIDTNYSSSPPGSNADGSYSETQARDLLADYHYLYQPLKRDNTFCVDYTDCVKFNLYYIEEATDNLKTIRSKHQ